MSAILKDFEDAARLRTPQNVRAVIWAVSIWYANQRGVRAIDYYTDHETHLRVQSHLQETFPEAMLLPGIYPDFGLIGEVAAFGGKIIWRENDAPVCEPCITSMEQVMSLKPVDVKTAGLFAMIYDRYDYFFKHINQNYITDYGYLDGSVYILGPAETAAGMRGYADFLLELYDNPLLAHKLMEYTTQTLLEYLAYLEKRIGKLKRIMVADHFACQISAEMFEEFCLPYMKQIYQAYPNAIKLYHNEGNVTHALELIAQMGADIFHFGVDVKEAKQRIGDKMCLMGNLDPISLMQNSTPDQILKAAAAVLEAGAPNGGFLLSTAGAVGTQTPIENVGAMIKAALIYNESFSNPAVRL